MRPRDRRSRQQARALSAAARRAARRGNDADAARIREDLRGGTYTAPQSCARFALRYYPTGGAA
jgi:hypothetical protein